MHKSHSTPGAVIHLTTNGTTPTAGSPAYSNPFNVTTTLTVRAIAIAPGYLNSNVSSDTYTRITQAAMPTCNPAPGWHTRCRNISPHAPIAARPFSSRFQHIRMYLFLRSTPPHPILEAF